MSRTRSPDSRPASPFSRARTAKDRGTDLAWLRQPHPVDGGDVLALERFGDAGRIGDLFRTLLVQRCVTVGLPCLLHRTPSKRSRDDNEIGAKVRESFIG